MKKLIVAAVLAGSMVAVAEESAVKPAEAAPVAVEAAKPVKSGQLTPEQIAERKARREKMMAERKAEMEKRALEVIKKYVSDEEKAKSLLTELEEAMKPARPQRPPKNKAPKAAPKAE